MKLKQNPINYLYFIFATLFLILLIASSIFTKNHPIETHYFFFLYALGQLFLEISIFLLLTLLAETYFGKISSFFFIALIFFALIVHVLDFILHRILDLTTWQAVQMFVISESWDNFLYLLDASGISPLGWILIFSSILFLPLLGLFLYKISHNMSQKKPLFLSHTFFIQTFILLPLALFIWDLSFFNKIHPDAYTAFKNTLPWKTTFLTPRQTELTIDPLKIPLNEELLSSYIEKDQTKLHQKPNIYIFVVESLREDAISQAIAPNLFQFKNDYTHFRTSLSNANGSHLSWFSIFHSEFSLFWKERQKNWKMGSPPLSLLKKWGYNIRLYSSAELGFYGMEKLLFGENRDLIDSINYFHHKKDVTAADTDLAAISKLQKDLLENEDLQQGQVFIIFWDSTHFDYCWPNDWTPKFTPYAENFTYFQAFHSQKTIQEIKNRYHNAVNYMDHLFGNFLNTLPKKEESIIVLTGDHGEEFFEKGHLFHLSHITKEQTHVPIYFKFGKEELKQVSREMVSQMDIFPSILHYVAKKNIPYFEGNSLFSKPKWDYAVSARFNAGGTPNEFAIQNEKYKLIAQFQDKSNIFKSKKINILSLRTQDDTPVEFETSTEEWIEKEFGSALKRLFPTPH